MISIAPRYSMKTNPIGFQRDSLNDRLCYVRDLRTMVIQDQTTATQTDIHIHTHRHAGRHTHIGTQIEINLLSETTLIQKHSDRETQIVK